MLNFKDDFSKIITVLSVYSVIVAVLYLWGYWSSFGVNILEFLVLTDIIKSSAYYIGWIFIIVIIIFPTVFLIMSLIPNVIHRIPWYLYSIISLSIFSIYAFMSLYSSFQSLGIFSYGIIWFLVFLSISIVIPLILLFVPAIKEYIQDNVLRTSLLCISCMIPPMVFGVGKYRSHTIIDGVNYQYIYTKSLDKKSTSTDSEAKLKYLGYANNYIFLLSMDNKTILIKNIDKIDDFELHTYKKSDEKEPEEKPNEQPK